MAPARDEFPFNTPAPRSAPTSAVEPRLPVDALNEGYSRPRSLLRLLVGGVLNGADDFARRMRKWESEYTQQRQQASQAVPPPPAQVGDAQGNWPEPFAARPGEADPHHTRHAVIGMLFESQERLRRLAVTARKGQLLVGRMLAPWLRRSAALPVFSPLQRRLDAWAQRGAEEVATWAAIGRQEEIHSRELARFALDGTVDEAINSLTHNPEVQELVQTQSTSLANEMIEEVRERSVSADTLLEGLVRRLTRLTPRKQLPGPPSDVRQRAVHLHPPRKRN